MLRLLLLLVVALSLVACDSNDPKALEMKPAELVKFEATAKLKKVWSKSAGSGQDKPFSRLVIAFDGRGSVYTAGVHGDVHAFEAATGKRLWKVDIDATISGGVGVGDGLVLVGTDDGVLQAMDAETGEFKWQAQLSSEIVSAPAADNSLVVANTIDGRVFAFDAASGEPRWSYDHTMPVLTLRGTSSPVITSSQVVVAFDNGQVLSLSASDGSVQWELRASRPQGRTELERIVDIDGTPVLDGGYLYLASYQGNVVAVSRGAGRTQWSAEASSPNAVAVSNGKVFVSTEASRVMAFNSVNGELLWENYELKRRGTGTPAAIGDYVAVTDKDGYLHLLNQSDGSFAYRFKPAGNSFRAPLVGYNNLLYTFADNGKLAAYALAE